MESDGEASCTDKGMVHGLTDHRAHRCGRRAIARPLRDQLWDLGCHSGLHRACGRQPCTEYERMTAPLTGAATNS